jgi:hypothetical protein
MKVKQICCRDVAIHSLHLWETHGCLNRQQRRVLILSGSEPSPTLRDSSLAYDSLSPQTNGRLEKFNDILTQMLVRMTAPTQQELWDEHLLDALLAHQAHTSSSTGVSPFFLLYGREAHLPSK